MKMMTILTRIMVITIVSNDIYCHSDTHDIDNDDIRVDFISIGGNCDQRRVNCWW